MANNIIRCIFSASRVSESIKISKVLGLENYKALVTGPKSCLENMDSETIEHPEILEAP